MAEANRAALRLQWGLHKVIWNLSRGRLGRKVIGMPVLELVTIGRVSGADRQILITYVDFEGAPAIIGTNAGRDTDPAWVGNLRAQPNARARWIGAWYDVTAVELADTKYRRVWEMAVKMNAGYAGYAKTLTRPIPIMHLVSR